jgi:arginine decarboxylase
VAERYHVERWGSGYFTVSPEGRLLVCPDPEDADASIDLAALAEELGNQHGCPLLFRFPQIIHHRVQSLCDAFREAIDRYGYGGDYVVAYPIKVNQQRQVIEAVMASASDGRNVGLEAGSKTELMAVLGMSENGHPLIVCNGYKDAEYIRLALLGEKMGHHVNIVVEKLNELDLILQQSKDLGIRPRIGVRVRLWASAAGKWQQSGGELSKFGLTPGQVLSMVNRLRQANMLDCLELLHFHLGSQIGNIRDIQRSLRECVQFYRALHEMGVQIRCFDVGGGLSIDYDGTRSGGENSSNYTMNDYADAIVHALHTVCDAHDLPHPTIISESGRAITAHHAVLVTNIIDCDTQEPIEPRDVREEDPEPLRQLAEAHAESQHIADPEEAQSLYFRAQDAIEEAAVLFSHGLMSLEQRAQADRLHRATCFQLIPVLSRGNGGPEELASKLERRLAAKIYANFSLFQSLPDAWAIDQIFPLVPLSHLNEPPAMHAVVQDITCDSDGEMAGYVDNGEIQPHLALPAYDPNDPYLLGFFLVGAYQEILGDMHNLYGDTNAFDVTLLDNGQVSVSPQPGDDGTTLLKYVGIEATALIESYRRQFGAQGLTDEQMEPLLLELTEGLYGYAYLEANHYGP